MRGRLFRVCKRKRKEEKGRRAEIENGRLNNCILLRDSRLLFVPFFPCRLLAKLKWISLRKLKEVIFVIKVVMNSLSFS